MPYSDKEKRRLRQKKYRKNNRDILNKKRREYREKNHEQVIEKERKYYEKNREKINLKSKKHYWNNREKELTRSRKYNFNNKEIKNRKRLIIHKLRRSEENKNEKVRQRNNIKTLHDSYIKKLICQNSILNYSDISDDMVSLYRENLLAKRELRSLKDGTNTASKNEHGRSSRASSGTNAKSKIGRTIRDEP